MSCNSQSATKKKYPNELLDYTIDFSDWLTEGDTIESGTWDYVTSGLTQEDATITDTSISVWVSGGVAGGRYPITGTATTAQGRVKQFQFTIRVEALPQP